MTKNFEILQWDTDFFGFKVAKIRNDSLKHENQNFPEILAKENVKLAYYNSEFPLSQNFSSNQYFDINLLVKRIPIVKKMKRISPIHDNISLYNKDYPEEDLIQLALLAGKQGRFGKDPNITETQYNELFKNWIINSVNKKMASDVLVYKEDGRIIGFITILVDGEKGYAPLFAVAREHEGTGISFALMQAAETMLVRKGCEIVISGTQERNKKALVVFKRYGFDIHKPEYVYHFWKKNDYKN